MNYGAAAVGWEETKADARADEDDNYASGLLAESADAAEKGVHFGERVHSRLVDQRRQMEAPASMAWRSTRPTDRSKAHPHRGGRFSTYGASGTRRALSGGGRCGGGTAWSASPRCCRSSTRGSSTRCARGTGRFGDHNCCSRRRAGHATRRASSASAGKTLASSSTPALQLWAAWEPYNYTPGFPTSLRDSKDARFHRCSVDLGRWRLLHVA